MAAENSRANRGLLPLWAGIFALLGAALALTLPSSAAAASGDSDAARGDEVTRCKHTKKHPKNLSPKKAKRAITCLVNKRRAERTLSRTDRSQALRKAGQRHTRRMRRTNCFAHQCGGEDALAGRAARASYLPCRCSWALGENIAWGSGRHGSARRIVKRWMASAAHRRNILTPRFSESGVGFVHGRPGLATRSAGMYTLVMGDKD